MDESDVDRKLVERIKAGQQDALATLYDKYVNRMFGVAYGILRNRGDAEDLMHDVFVEAWQKLKHYNPQRGTVYSWLMIRVRSRAIDRIRSLKVAQNHAMLQKPLDTFDQSSSDHSALSSDAQRARQALSNLSARQREVIELGYFKGLTCREISGICGIPIGTVKSRLASGVAKLRQQLVPHTEEHDV